MKSERPGLVPLDITNYLKEKYRPKAIIIHGSRLSGDAFPDSDYDLAIITDNHDAVRPEDYNGCLLDASGVSPQEVILKAGQTPIWPCEVLFDSDDLLGQILVQRTHQAFLAGPQSLLQQEINNRKNYTKRLLLRLDSRGDDLLIRNYYLSDLYDRVIRYWFEFRKQWTQPIYRALPTIKNEDPDFYALLEKLWAEAYLQSAKQIYLHIFGDKE